MTVLSPDQVASVLLQAASEMGVQLTRAELVGLTEIPSRESGYDTMAHNNNAATGDDSYSLWQINMLGLMGESRRRALGISSNDALYDPVTSAKAAIQLVLSGRAQGDPLRAWGGYKGMSNTYNVSSAADAAAQSAVDRVMAGGGTALPSSMGQTLGSSSKPSASGKLLVDFLNQQIGKPYVFGSTGPTSFDCSGLVTAAYKQLGISLPPSTFSQDMYGTKVSTDQLQPGDLMFRHGSQGDFGHVGVYIGGGQVIAAPHTGAFVGTEPVADWIAAANAPGGTVRRIIDGSGSVIIGDGLVPQHTPNVGQVTVSQAMKMPDALTPTTGANDPFALTPESNVPRKIIEDRQPFVLPGYGSQLPSLPALTP